MLQAQMQTVFLIALLVFSKSALAGPIVLGVEWFEPRDLAFTYPSSSWNDLNATCPAGVCSGRLGTSGPDLTGWTWASVDEVNALFNFFIESTEGISPLGPGPSSYSNPSGGFTAAARAVFQNNLFGGSPSEFIRGVGGWTRDPVPNNPDRAYYADIFSGFNEFNSFQGASTRTAAFRSARPNGAWLYRSVVDVPAPSALLLVLIGLGLIRFTRRPA